MAIRQLHQPSLGPQGPPVPALVFPHRESLVSPGQVAADIASLPEDGVSALLALVGAGADAAEADQDVGTGAG